MHYTYLTPTDRGMIQAYLESGYTQQDIAEAIGKSASTISRELKRNTTSGISYNANVAQKRYETVREACRPRLKLADNPECLYCIQERLC